MEDGAESPVMNFGVIIDKRNDRTFCVTLCMGVFGTIRGCTYVYA